MKKYNINKMLKEWGGSSIASQNPYDSADGSPEDVEDLTGDNGEAGAGISDLTTNYPGPSNPKNIPGSDREKVMKEAPGDIMSTSKKPTMPSNKPPKKEPPMVTPDMKMDPSMMGPDPSGNMSGVDPNMMDPSMMGMGVSGPMDSGEVGRVYELKKIYSRLVSMQSYLAGTTDINLIKLRNYVSNTMDLFRTLISNIALYKDKLDEIIVVFYKVVDNVYVILSKYYKDNTTGKMVQAVE